MKSRFFLFGFALLCFVSGAYGAWAETTASAKVTLPPAVIAVVDMQRILEESLGAKSVQQQIEAQRAKFQSEISGEEGDLRQAEKDLVKLRDTVAPDVYADKEQQLRQRFVGVERHVQTRRKALDQAFTDSMNVVRKSLLDIVGAIAGERGCNMVIVKQQAIWSDKSMDITSEVLARLNKDLPSVPVKVVADEETKEPLAKSSGSLLKKKGR
jgi:outer membrane protein